MASLENVTHNTYLVCSKFPTALYLAVVVFRSGLRNNITIKIYTMWLTNVRIKLLATQFPALALSQHAGTNLEARPLFT